MYSKAKSMFINPCNHVCSSLWLHHPALALSVFFSGGDNMSVSFKIQETRFLNFLFIQGECLPNVEDCGHTGKLPGVNVYTRTVEREAQLHGSCACNKNSSCWWDFEPVTSWCAAHFILWPFSHFHPCPLSAGLAHQSCRNTSSLSTDISKYQCRAHDALLSTNNVVLIVYLWHR